MLITVQLHQQQRHVPLHCLPPFQSAHLPPSLTDTPCSPFFPPVAKLKLLCTRSQKDTEIQHVWLPHQRREGSVSPWAFCLAAIKEKLSVRSCLLSSSFSPVVTLLSFIHRAHPATHPWRQWGHYLSAG